jgi:hypothetical protein
MKTIFIYIFANWGMSIMNDNFIHPLYPDAQPTQILNAIECPEPTNKIRRDIIQAGDTVCVNIIKDNYDFVKTQWMVIVEENLQ